MVELIGESVRRGIERLERFEELPLFNDGIGPDLVSDICGNVLKHRLITYTQRICTRHDVLVTEFLLTHARFDMDDGRWVDERVRLPADPLGRPVLLVPEAFLMPLPVVDWQDFRDYAWSSHGEDIAADFGFDVKARLNKAAIVRIARRRGEWVKAFLARIESGAAPYDLSADRAGVYQPYVAARTAALESTAAAPRVEAAKDLGQFVDWLVDDYRHFIEDQRGSRILWNEDGTARRELAAQLVFLARVEVHCAHNDVHMVGEADLGRGPVDFEFATGYRGRVVLEIKLMTNSKYWHGLESQLPNYMTASRAPFGHFVGIATKTCHFTSERWVDLPTRTAQVASRLAKPVRSTAIDGTLKPSASVR